MVKKWNLLLVALLVVSCKRYDPWGMLAAGSSVQERFGNSVNLPDRNSHADKVAVPSGGYVFRVATDLHIRDEEWNRVGCFLSDAAHGSSLAVLLGDYMYVAGSSLDRLADSIDAQLDFPVFTAIGNHEVYQKGYQHAYRPAFGATCYSFRVETGSVYDLFVILDSANGTLGRDQFGWLESLLSSNERASARHCFVFTHTNFFNPAGYAEAISTYPVEEQMKLLNIFSKRGVTAVFTGHSHVRDETTVRGVRYITVGSWCEGKRGGEYCRVECAADGRWSYDFGSVD